MPDLNDLTCRRSRRQKKPSVASKESNDPITRRLHGLMTFLVLFTAVAGKFAGSIASGPQYCMTTWEKAVKHSERINLHFDNTLNAVHHAVLMTGGDSNDVYTFKEMLAQPDKADFIEAMMKEVSDHKV